MNAVDAASDLERPTISASLVPALDQVPGVDKAVGSVSGAVDLISPHTGKSVRNGPAPGIGTNWAGDEPTSAETIAEGRPPGAGEVVVD
nr:hypothetical protein [Micromonospora sp. DSM 115978]